MSGRSCSLGRTVFFEAQAFATDETPHGSIVHFEAAGGELGDKPPQGEAPLRDPFPKKVSVLAGQQPRPVAAHLPCRSTSRCPEPLRPFHHARRADAQRPSNHAHALARLHPRNRPLAQIHRIGSCHLPKASDSNITFESETRQFGNPTDSAKSHPALVGQAPIGIKDFTSATKPR